MIPLLIFWITLATIDPIVGIIIVAIVGPLGTYIAAARKMSGKIGTSEAQQLWDESRSIREWSEKRIEACDKEISELRETLRKVLARLHNVEEQNARLTRELHAARVQLGEEMPQ